MDAKIDPQGVNIASEFTTVLSRNDSYAKVSALLEGALSVSDLASPILLGATADLLGINRMFLLCAVGFFALAIAMLWMPRAREAEDLPAA